MSETITKTMLDRLHLQAEEAKLLGLTKVANNLEKQIKSNQNNTRDTDSAYTYTREQMQDDVQQSLWNAFIRVADFYASNFDAEQAQKSIEKIASDLVDEVRINSGVLDGVGAYEPSIPGEQREVISIEVGEE